MSNPKGRTLKLRFDEYSGNYDYWGMMSEAEAAPYRAWNWDWKNGNLPQDSVLFDRDSNRDHNTGGWYVFEDEDWLELVCVKRSYYCYSRLAEMSDTRDHDFGRAILDDVDLGRFNISEIVGKIHNRLTVYWARLELVDHPIHRHHMCYMHDNYYFDKEWLKAGDYTETTRLETEYRYRFLTRPEDRPKHPTWGEL